MIKPEPCPLIGMYVCTWPSCRCDLMNPKLRIAFVGDTWQIRDDISVYGRYSSEGEAAVVLEKIKKGEIDKKR